MRLLAAATAGLVAGIITAGGITGTGATADDPTVCPRVGYSEQWQTRETSRGEAQVKLTTTVQRSCGWLPIRRR